MRFWLVIGKERFYVYSKENHDLELEYIDGNPYRRYNPQDIKRETKSLMETLANVNNLGSVDELEFSVVENSDRVRNANVATVLAESMKEKIALKKLIVQAMNDLQKDKALHIEEYGINYDGDTYKLFGGEVKQVEYSLLGYRLETDKLIHYC